MRPNACLVPSHVPDVDALAHAAHNLCATTPSVVLLRRGADAAIRIGFTDLDIYRRQGMHGLWLEGVPKGLCGEIGALGAGVGIERGRVAWIAFAPRDDSTGMIPRVPSTATRWERLLPAWSHCCTGMDLVFVDDAYVYHTADDSFEHVARGALQHLGDNLLGIVEGLAGR